MAKDGPGGERTEKPTPQRLKKARKEGQIPRTPELGAWAAMAAASVLLPMLVRNSFQSVQSMFVRIAGVARAPQQSDVTTVLGDALSTFLSSVLPTALGLMAVGVAFSVAQGGVTVSGKALKPTWKKLNPFTGVKRMFGGHGVWEAVKALAKTVVLGTTLYATADTARTLVSSSGAMPLSTVVASFAGAAVLMLRVAAITGLVLAAADYFVVRRRMMGKLKMSRYEIQQEHKQNEGDPHLRAHRKAQQLALARNRMMTDVGKADVLLVNPTHVAVALKYDPTRGAPRVVAKGSGEIAAKLREKATEARVPLVQDVPLARALHASCDVGQEVPAQLFTAVARVLAFVMHLGARGVVGGFHRPGFEPPPPDLVEALPKAGRRRA
jgi:flagellar biosynthetic protein FlhB